ncbi:MAG: HAD family hydrolase [Muribaculaceae bacterium]|nr:HAD family hydrolase [Muribaculaceae bacterium]
MKQLVIFDLDGTLLNTIEDLGHAANYALQKHGMPTHTLASYPFFVGNGVRRLITRVLPEDKRDADTVDLILRDFKEYYDAHNTLYTKPYSCIPELLMDLRDMGVKMAVASNKYQSATEQIINHYFGDIEWVAVAGQREGVNVKPDPTVVFYILSQAHVPKADALYVGDSGVDMETARRACIDSVGVTWGFRPEKELVENYAGRIVHRPLDILDVVHDGIYATKK